MYVSRSISGGGSWESEYTYLLEKALKYYSNKKNISNENIYVLDIGANVGWFSFYFGKCGYNILSFEASKLNDYILRKNFCLNNESRIAIINKGIYNDEKKCFYYLVKNNYGNGIVYCNKIENKTDELINMGLITITKLSNFVPFLSSKNVALIKLDIEGGEGKAIESGIELISKYHVPFIFL